MYKHMFMRAKRQRPLRAAVRKQGVRGERTAEGLPGSRHGRCLDTRLHPRRPYRCLDLTDFQTGSGQTFFVHRSAINSHKFAHSYVYTICQSCRPIISYNLSVRPSSPGLRDSRGARLGLGPRRALPGGGGLHDMLKFDIICLYNLPVYE